MKTIPIPKEPLEAAINDLVTFLYENDYNEKEYNEKLKDYEKLLKWSYNTHSKIEKVQNHFTCTSNIQIDNIYVNGIGPDKLDSLLDLLKEFQKFS